MAYIGVVNITLPAGQEHWLEARIANGEFQSVDDAIRQLIAERMMTDNDELHWAKPLVNEARAAVARGEVSRLEEAERDIEQTLASLGR